MNNYGFKNPMELSYHQLIDAIHELERRVVNAENGYKVFKEEAQLSRTELLKWREIAGQADDSHIELTITVERHLEALLAVADSGYESASEQSDFITIVRLLRYMLRNTLVNFRREFMDSQEERDEYDDLSDIPF